MVGESSSRGDEMDSFQQGQPGSGWDDFLNLGEDSYLEGFLGGYGDSFETPQQQLASHEALSETLLTDFPQAYPLDPLEVGHGSGSTHAQEQGYDQQQPIEAAQFAQHLVHSPAQLPSPLPQNLQQQPAQFQNHIVSQHPQPIGFLPLHHPLPNIDFTPRQLASTVVLAQERLRISDELAAHQARHSQLAAQEAALLVDPGYQVLCSRQLDTLRFLHWHGHIGVDAIEAQLAGLRSLAAARLQAVRDAGAACRAGACAVVPRAFPLEPFVDAGAAGFASGPGIEELGTGSSFFDYVMRYCGEEAQCGIDGRGPAQMDHERDRASARRAWLNLGPNMRVKIDWPENGYADLVRGWYVAVWGPGFAERQREALLNIQVEAERLRLKGEGARG